MVKKIAFLVVCLIAVVTISKSQTVPIDNYSVNGFGQAQLSIQAQEGKYYILHAQHSATYTWAVSMTLGVNGTMVITEPGGAYPLENYFITEHDISAPDDYDGDGIDDISEFNNMPTDAPLNFAAPVDFIDGTTSIPDAETFLALATINNVGWAPFLDGQLYVKFGILDRDTPEPKVYFINSNTHIIHAGFFNAIGAAVNGDDGSGEIVFNPNDILPNGTIGSYSFNFSFGDAYNFQATQRTFELLAANMPFLRNNMNHFIGQSDENVHLNQFADQFVGSRIEVVLESDVFAEINFIPFNEAEGYGFFKYMNNLSETPGSRDIVLYDALPNSLPRVGGIITSVIQTPLSHVNLRAIQDNVPNAYIEDPLSIDSIANLVGNYIYYKVENKRYQIREATLAEVNAWYEDLRPTEPQTPIRDLSITEILALDDIEFDMSTAFGAKCSNLATMRTFGFPNGTIPNGFGIPFYYYDEFMKFNNFYEEAQVMIDNPVFQNDLNFRIERLKDFRADIRNAPMPPWIMSDLQAMHDQFPAGTSVRCRSSTNNEDLPGFSGAGLYTSKTQHPHEGHISKSVKQVYASMWNFRAYEERDFSRVDHFAAAMGVLCHPNFQEELSNGVGISIDPIYDTENTFYLNTQVGESLITNPDPNSEPEEILLYQDPTQGGGYLVLRLSNLVNPGELVMDQIYLDQMRDYLTVIHDEFAELYDVAGAEGFGMDIEYKVTAQNQLAIKQARPWVSFWSNIKANNDLGVAAIVAPETSSSLGNNELVTATISNNGLNDMSNFTIELVINDELIEIMTVSQTIQPFSDADFQFSTPYDFSEIGDYNVKVMLSHADDEYSKNDTLDFIISKVPVLDGELSIEETSVACNNVVEVNALVTNQGETTITSVQIQVAVNGLVVDIINASVNIPFKDQGTVTITIDENLQETNNNISLNLLSVNSFIDGDLTNNSISTIANSSSDYDIITLIINADNYPQETSWKIYEEGANQIIASGALQFGAQGYTEDICVNYNSCYSLYVYDSFGDGICCGFGQGDFSVLDAAGNQLVFNNGNFGDEAQELFCPNGSGCSITASVNISHATSESVEDGIITINANLGLSPYRYSIDGGQTWSASNIFTNLSTGTYPVFIQDVNEICSFEETVTIQACSLTAVNIETTGASSVVSTNGSIVIHPSLEAVPFEYSIDGGQSFVTSNEFPNLPVGAYNVVVKDASNICYYEATAIVDVCELDVIVQSVNTSSEVANDGAISIFPIAGMNPFQYSIDGGENFFENNQFSGLEPGTYDIVVEDASIGCSYQENITIIIDALGIASNESSNRIKIYPNPTSNFFNIEIESFSWQEDKINIDVYDHLGRTIQTGSISKHDNGKSIIFLDDYASGTYFVKCYNSTFEKYFKVVKIEDLR